MIKGLQKEVYNKDYFGVQDFRSMRNVYFNHNGSTVIWKTCKNLLLTLHLILVKKSYWYETTKNKVYF